MGEQTWASDVSASDEDQALLCAMAEGDESALHCLYQRHGRYILAYLVGKLGNRLLAEETLQDVMLAAWKGAAGFRGQSRVRTWLLAIARHKAISLQRRRQVPRVSLDNSPALIDPDAQQELERAFDSQALTAVWESLSAEHREILELVFFQGLTGPEIARLLGVAPGTVKSRLYRAKEALGGLLRRGDGYGGR